jgi:hypothetical protein
MRALSLVLLGAGLLLAGCTRVAFRTPVGKAVEAKDRDELLMGEWTGEKGTVWTVDHDPKSGLLRASWREDGKAQTRLLVLTTLGQSESLIWEKEDDLNAYVPLRVAGAEEALALLRPDDKMLGKLVADGKVAAAFDKEKNAWTLPDGDWASLLERADFWDMDTSMPFVRNLRPKASATLSAPAAPPPGP